MKRANLMLGLLVAISIGLASCHSSSCKHADHKDVALMVIDLSEDKGGMPWALDIEEATLQNEDYRVANWTGKYMQLVFMNLKPGEVIDLELHEDHDQFIRIEEGTALVQMGVDPQQFTFNEVVIDDWAVMIPAGYWHRIENVGDDELKLYTLYGPPEHAKGTVHATYQEAKESHDHH